MATKETFQQAAQEAPPNLFSEFLMFLAHNKKWWLLPILVVMALLGTLIFLSGSPLAPFVYTLF